MRLAIFADTHGNQMAWRAFTALLPSLEADEVLFLGDVFGYGYGQPEILDGLAAMDGLIWLKGNHDRLFFDVWEGDLPPSLLAARYGSSYRLHRGLTGSALEKLRACPSHIVFEREGVRVWAGHGHPLDPEEGRLYPKDLQEVPRGIVEAGDVVIMGHTHFRLERRVGPALLVNPGSLGQPRDFQPASMAVLTLPGKSVEFIDIDYDRAPLEAEARQYDPGNEKLVELLYRGVERWGHR